jgi:taurine dioxygenase
MAITTPAAESDVYHRISVEALTPTIGAEVHGVDLADVDDKTWDELQAAFARHLVLFFRDQQLSPEQNKAFGRLGPLHAHPAAPHLSGRPEVMIIRADERSKVVADNG